MRLAMYLLLSANLVLALFVWLDYRATAPSTSYSHLDSVATLELVVGDELGGGRGCWLFGPMASREGAEQIKVEMVAAGFPATVVETEQLKAPGYWVYYGEYQRYEDSLAQLREFQKKGIDSFIIGRGELQGSISLGVFENIDSARRMTKIMSRKGYETKMYEIIRHSNEFWVGLDRPVNQAEKLVIERFLSAQKSLVERRQIFCK